VSQEEKCPRCGSDLEYDEVDIGVGIQRGNPGCPDCHWVPGEDEVVDPLDPNEGHPLTKIREGRPQ
jgi:ribosomal protein S27AE